MPANAVTQSPFICFKDVELTLGEPGRSVEILKPIQLELNAHSFTAIVGPSGCGKTSLLNMLTSVVAPTAGAITIAGQSIATSKAKIGYLLSRDALLHWRTAQRNVELPLELDGKVSSKERARIARDLLDRVGLRGFEDHRIRALSHGMRQRVSLARILAYDPEILLLDEPFSSLDALTRMVAQELFLEIWQRDQKTVLLVTHDIEEAIFMADEVLVFSPQPGRILKRFRSDFPRPREIEKLRRNDQFNQLYGDVLSLITSARRTGPVTR